MTLIWAIVYLLVGAFSGVLPDVVFWNAWSITLLIAVILDILL